MSGAVLSHAMEGRADSLAQAVEPVELGPSTTDPEDRDSPDRASLTILGLARFLNMSKDWATKNRRRVKGWFRSGKAWRFDRATVAAARAAGQVLEERPKSVSLGLKRRRR